MKKCSKRQHRWKRRRTNRIIRCLNDHHLKNRQTDRQVQTSSDFERTTLFIMCSLLILLFVALKPLFLSLSSLYALFIARIIFSGMSFDKILSKLIKTCWLRLYSTENLATLGRNRFLSVNMTNLYSLLFRVFKYRTCGNDLSNSDREHFTQYPYVQNEWERDRGVAFKLLDNGQVVLNGLARSRLRANENTSKNPAWLATTSPILFSLILLVSSHSQTFPLRQAYFWDYAEKKRLTKERSIIHFALTMPLWLMRCCSRDRTHSKDFQQM